MAKMTYDEKVKSYIKIAVILGVITVVEVLLTQVPHSEQPMKTIITMLIVALSCSKAFFVAYYYMHLNHEKKWTIWVAASPLCVLIYVGALIADTPSRPISIYAGEPARGTVFPVTKIDDTGEVAIEAEEAVVEPEEGGEWE